MPSVLIISELFYPMNRIGAVRPTKLAKFLALKKYNVTVFTSSDCLLYSNEKVSLPYRVIYANNDENQQNNIIEKRASVNRDSKTASNSKKIRFDNSIVQELKMTKRQFILYKKGKDFLQLFCKYIDSRTISLEDFDCVFSTFGPIGSLLCGLEAKKRYPSIVWINDFRDPMVSQIMPKSFAPYYNYLQHKSIDLADHTITVSEGYKKRLSFLKMRGNISVIPNGFDKDDILIEDVVYDGKFSFAYVGALYEGKRDLSVLFSCLKSLIDEKILDSNAVCFHYAGSEGDVIISQAKKFSLEGIICDHGLVNRQESIRIQSCVRFLVLSTWNDKGEEGVFPGKLLEYMLIDKPVVSIVGGSLSNSEVTQVIRKMRLGISYEKADLNTKKQLYMWLKKQAVQFVSGKNVLFNPDREAISRAYNWESLVERFSELING